MGIQVVEKEELKVVGISWTGTYSQVHTIPSLFQKLEDRLEEVANQSNDPVFIAPFHRRETEFTYYVTKPVEKIDVLPEGMIGFNIPSKNYVFTTHQGAPEEVENTYLQVLSWMKDYGYELDQSALSLAIYHKDDKQRNEAGNLYFDIYLPVKSYRK
ncbi:GyrI-like domain-containing protein [Neobacillus jeddahensis]|uniref:GyrI-like domain-containing protein n=1 Tax=Neobacillus jeddahensis TaxID=1461580 RepID=UPI00058D77CB|nr:GyrI-like domain-containing protein [Neobacillus jeddahensis]